MKLSQADNFFMFQYCDRVCDGFTVRCLFCCKDLVQDCNNADSLAVINLFAKLNEVSLPSYSGIHSLWGRGTLNQNAIN